MGVGMGSCFLVAVGIISGIAVSGCAPSGARDVRSSLPNDEAAKHVQMLNSVQISEETRQPYERAVLGLRRMNANGDLIGPCGSVLIRPDVVLTAGHCLDPSQSSDYAMVHVETVVDLQTTTAETTSARKVVKVIHHPLYKSMQKIDNGITPKQYDHDMAIAILDRPFDSSIQPQPLAGSGEDITAGQELTVYGFGRGIDYGGSRGDPAAKFYGTLQRGVLQMSGQNYFDRAMSNPKSKNFLCDGDSGGPAFLVSKNKKNPPIVMGVNSAQMGRLISKFTPTRYCKDAPSVLQAVAPFRAWIDQVLRENGK